MTLRVGSKGPEVQQWQNFLLGEGLYFQEVNGVFDLATEGATIAFQQLMGLTSDGVAGARTLATAMARGMPVALTPATGKPLSAAERAAIFGTFAFKPAGNERDPEAIVITDGWGSKNITMVEIPQLAGILGAPAHCRVAFHVKAAAQFKALWQAWDDAGLMPLVLSFAGTWAPRFIRGSRTALSNHAFGTAFDINAGWNGLGKVGAALGQKGSVKALVPLAEQHGFINGAQFSRRDDMHFEVNRLV